MLYIAIKLYQIMCIHSGHAVTVIINIQAHLCSPIVSSAIEEILEHIKQKYLSLIQKLAIIQNWANKHIEFCIKTLLKYFLIKQFFGKNTQKKCSRETAKQLFIIFSKKINQFCSTGLLKIFIDCRYPWISLEFVESIAQK